RDMEFLDRALRQGIDEGVGVEPMVQRVHIDILDIKKDASAALAADHADKLCLGQFCVGPFEDMGDVLEQERHPDARTDSANLLDDRLGNAPSPRQRKEVGKITSGNASEGEMLAV